MNEESLSNVTLSWCVYVNIWDESIIFLMYVYQFMKEKKFKKGTSILLETIYYIYFIISWMKKSIKCNSTLIYPRQHLRRKHHILDWIHIISVHEGKKSIKCNFTLMYQPQHWDKSIIFLIEYMLYQFMKEKSLSNVTLPWCIHTNIWDESIIFLIDSRPSSTHFDTEASRRFLVRYLTTHNTSDFTHRFLDQKFC